MFLVTIFVANFCASALKHNAYSKKLCIRYRTANFFKKHIFNILKRCIHLAHILRFILISRARPHSILIIFNLMPLAVFCREVYFSRVSYKPTLFTGCSADWRARHCQDGNGERLHSKIRCRKAHEQRVQFFIRYNSTISSGLAIISSWVR